MPGYPQFLGSGTVERRASFGVRVAGRHLEGHAALFNSETRIGTFTETIAPGAFSAALADNSDILALVDHDPSRLLARSRSRTLTMTEDSKGLAFRIAVPDTQLGNDMLALAERGDLGGMSFGFLVPDGGETWQGDKRQLTAIDLREISVVTAFPAYEGTDIAARSRRPSTPGLDYVRRYLETC